MGAELQLRAVAGARQQLAGVGSETLSFTGAASCRLVPGPAQGSSTGCGSSIQVSALVQKLILAHAERTNHFEVWHDTLSLS